MMKETQAEGTNFKGTYISPKEYRETFLEEVMKLGPKRRATRGRVGRKTGVQLHENA